MKKLIILFVVNALFISGCTNTVKNEESNFIINNDILVDNILEYYNKYLTEADFEYILSIDYSRKGDVDIFNISHNINMSRFLYYPPLLFITIDDKDVMVQNSMARFINIADVELEKKMEKHFPIQYAVYKSGLIPAPTTGSHISWVLKFRNNKLISREINDY